MALDFNRVLATANGVEDICNQMVVLRTMMAQLITFNSNQAINWGAQSTPEYITESANGNIQGKSYSRQEVSNAIGSINTVLTAFDTDHLGNLNHLARPLG